MINSPRSTRNSVPPSFPAELDALTSFLDNQLLTPKSKLDEFRRFFDLKTEWWNKLHNKFKAHAQLRSNWVEMHEDEALRQEIAAEFIDQVGNEYWCRENQEKYLMEEHVQSGHACVYPKDRKAMIKALSYLLEKDAKNRRGSLSHKVSFRSSKGDDRQAPSSSSSLSDPPSTELESPASVKMDISEASSPLATMKGAHRSTSGIIHGSIEMRSVDSQETKMSLENPRLEDSCSAEDEDALISSHAVACRGSSHRVDDGNRRPCCQAHTSASDLASGLTETFLSQFSDTASLTQATFFLVHEHSAENPAVCVPFRNFEEYQTATEFLDEMWKRCCCAQEPSLIQLVGGVRQYSHAVVSLCWSGVSFVLREDTDDLQSLVDRISCAWRAKQKGEWGLFELAVRVVLKNDED
ncbi:hypothetical protein N7539_005730 [Penicillium diatomitis]|uniref:Uncharacterized protein n=1 Tax=Penicillium diatomitis TaxID=2819901 RepID=A0A9W9X656_9EURO|nr:uncharacterized protein N7539_005730 [Penicillium diatomitis]KAJ5483934.1 hypothetical protein N7539_005730 [Penicillium diatomitis]